MTMRIVLMGPPGSGKGTEAELLVKHYHIPHISTGNIFRELYKDKTAVGKTAKAYIDRGELVPDQITNEIVKHRLMRKDCKQGFLFDGYPRNIEQAKAFDQMLEDLNWKLTAVINIDATDEVIIKRIAGRRVCSTCGAVYHTINKKPQVEGICDVDGGKLIQRADDMEETVRWRLKVYKEQTAPVVGYYREKGTLIEVDGSHGIDDTDRAIQKVLGEMN
jgi:adenylate kinase